MRVLIGCECSDTVRKAFEDEGHDAWSCDLKPSEVAGSNKHIQADLFDVLDPSNVILYGTWDVLIVMHPPCTRLCNSGVRWYSKPPTNPPSSCTEEEALAWPNLSNDDRLKMLWTHLDRGAEFFDKCLNVGIEFVACENPVMHKYAKKRINFGEVQPFYVQPWQFGCDEDGPDNEKKRTGFWCRNLPKLVPTGTLDGSTARNSVHHATPGEDRATERSRFFPGLAKAMAVQWGTHASRAA